ncbi:MAG: hypothetical protein K2K32_10280, partial [Muribaculaceae bacterium]|nr:hypothetical protein [Muribaculaceae bacterium]
ADIPVIAFMEETVEESITNPDTMQASENKNAVIENFEDNAIFEGTSAEITEFDESEDINRIADIDESEDINEIADIDESEDNNEIAYIDESKDINEIAIPDGPGDSEEIDASTMQEDTERIDETLAVSQVLAETSEAEEEPEAESSRDVKENQPEEETDESDEFQEIDLKKIRKNNWKKGILIGLAAAVCALFATFAIWYVFATNDFNKFFNKTAANNPEAKDSELIVDNSQNSNANVESTPAIALEDSVADSASSLETEMEVPTSPSDPVVYDTISTTRYLTTMAKAHYGNYNLWPYIYEENKSKLGHPDRIRPGTPVVIPKLSKYGVDAANPADIEKAKKMGVEIYSRYGKSI